MAFRILSIDGGGVRGIYPVHILKRISEEFGLVFSRSFDLIAGTSTGSIIAAAAALDSPMVDLAELYEQKAAHIFRRRLSAQGLLRSAHDAGPLKTLLEEVFGGAQMKDAKTRLFIPATDVSNGNVFVTKSPYLESFVRDRNTRIAEAVLASCSAPSYFNPARVREYLLADGGLWANNPALLCYVEAVGKLGVAQADVQILSLGTGTSDKAYDVGRADRRAWGLATGWRRKDLIDLVFNLQSRSAHNMLQLLLADRYKRISFGESGKLPLDDPRIMPRLKARADQDFTYESPSIRSFLRL